MQRWLSAGSPAEADAAFLAAQQRALEMVPTIPLGRTFSDGAIRTDIKGALHGSVNVFWNARRG